MDKGMADRVAQQMASKRANDPEYKAVAMREAGFILEALLDGLPSVEDEPEPNASGDFEGLFTVTGTVAHSRGTSRVFEPFVAAVDVARLDDPRWVSASVNGEELDFSPEAD